MRKCSECSNGFRINDQDRAYYSKLGVPLPTYCPSCRLQRRTAFRNERHFHHCCCDHCGKQTVSTYPDQHSYPIYCANCWWSDEWEPKGNRNYDFEKSFFDQFADLKSRIPRLSLFNQKSENSLYTNHSEQNRNCYLCITTFRSENIMHSRKVYDSEDCVDCHWIVHCSNCYELVHCEHCYECYFGDELRNCDNCFFCSNLNNCRNCLFSHNLSHKEYYIFNRPVPREDFERQRKGLENYSTLSEYLARFSQLREKVQVRNLILLSSENCKGDYLTNCCNCRDSFYLTNVNDSAYSLEGSNATDMCDAFGFGVEPTELCLEVMGIVGCYNVCFSTMCYHCRDVYYSDLCFNSHDLFGCVGLNHKEYCIFNTQYSPEKYHDLRERIIEQMSITGEWGEFFPISSSPFAYNETVAYEYFPVKRLEVQQNGWIWAEEERHSAGELSKKAELLADSIRDLPSDVSKTALLCSHSSRPFRIQPAELKFYKRQGIAAPRFHPDLRWAARRRYRNPPVLTERSCAVCERKIMSSYLEDRPEKVLCSACYQDLL